MVPGGMLLALAVALVNGPLFAQVASSLSFYYAAAFTAGLLLAWRFNSSRILFSLLTLLLAHRAVDFFSSGHPYTGPGTGRPTGCAFDCAQFHCVRRHAGTGTYDRRDRAAFRPAVYRIRRSCDFVPTGEQRGRAAASAEFVRCSIWAMAGLVAAVGLFIRRYLQTRKPMKPGFVWSVTAVVLWLEIAPIGKASDAYVATAALILAASLIETSYVLAYFDELTGIRGRRGFNEALLSLDQQYAIAIVDIDHFKKFNDTYGQTWATRFCAWWRLESQRWGAAGRRFVAAARSSL